MNIKEMTDLSERIKKFKNQITEENREKLSEKYNKLLAAWGEALNRAIRSGDINDKLFLLETAEDMMMALWITLADKFKLAELLKE
jgi:hypothetical protein